MKKFENIDIKYALENIMHSHTENFREDFDIDIKIMSESSKSDDPEMRHILWMSRPSGTHCLPEREVHLDGSRSNHTWRFYAEQTRDMVFAYAITLDKTDGGTLTGNLYELDYQAHAKRIKEIALPIHYFTTVFMDGAEYRRLKSEKASPESDRMVKEHGQVACYKDEPEYEGELLTILNRERRDREYHAKPYSLEKYLAETRESEFVSRVTDPSVTIRDMHEYGYHYTNMIPMGKEKALELFDKDYQIYLLHMDDAESAAESKEDIKEHYGLFGCEYENLDDRLSHEKAGIHDYLIQPKDGTEDTFSIYQLKHDDTTMPYRFESTERLNAAGLAVDAGNYKHIYTAALDGRASLESIFTKFNIDRPFDFEGHSLSVSDIVVLKRDGVLSAHYVDGIGFTDVPEFLRGTGEKPSVIGLLNAEKAEAPTQAITSVTKRKAPETERG